jgi:hypothetical protein
MKQRTAHSFVTYYITYVHVTYYRPTVHCYGNPKLHNDSNESDTNNLLYR